MKKVKLIVAAFAMLGFMSGPAAYAANLAPAEGLFLGLFAGHGAGHVSAKTTAQSWKPGTTTTTTDTFEIKDGGIGLSGVEGGGWLGYGYKVGDAHIGWEMDAAAGGGKFELTSTNALMISTATAENTTLSKAAAEMQWNAGVSGVLGYYVNKDTLVAFTGGISAAKFKVTWADQSEKFYGGGPRIGASITSRLSAIDPNLSVRLAGNYTDYMTAPVSGIGTIDNDSSSSNDSEVSGAAYNVRFGLLYSFMDVNSLF